MGAIFFNWNFICYVLFLFTQYLKLFIKTPRPDKLKAEYFKYIQNFEDKIGKYGILTLKDKDK